MEANMKNLKKFFTIKKIYLDDYIDVYNRHRLCGTAYAIVKDFQILKTYSSKKNLYKHLAKARRKSIDLFVFVFL